MISERTEREVEICISLLRERAPVVAGKRQGAIFRSPKKTLDDKTLFVL